MSAKKKAPHRDANDLYKMFFFFVKEDSNMFVDSFYISK